MPAALVNNNTCATRHPDRAPYPLLIQKSRGLRQVPGCLPPEDDDIRDSAPDRMLEEAVGTCRHFVRRGLRSKAAGGKDINNALVGAEPESILDRFNLAKNGGRRNADQLRCPRRSDR
jgi:hypothetical protein